MATAEDYRYRKIKSIQKNFWFPFESERTLKETAKATGLTEKEIILRGINLISAQSKQLVN
jgi:hypothetical protein